MILTAYYDNHVSDHHLVKDKQIDAKGVGQHWISDAELMLIKEWFEVEVGAPTQMSVCGCHQKKKKKKNTKFVNKKKT